jgi:hypothetical protein
MSRSQLNRVRALAGFSAGVAVVVLGAVVRGSDVFFTAKVGTADNAVALVDVCGDDGRIKVFKDADDFIKQAAKLSVFSTAGVAMSVANLSALDPKPFTGDIIAKARTTLASYTASKAKLNLASTDLGAAIGLMPSNTAAEIAFKAEKQAQKDAVDAQVTWLTAEITRITGLLPPV